MMKSRPSVAIALPARNEAQYLAVTLKALDAAAECYGGHVSVVVLANNCSDTTLDLLRAARLKHAEIHWCGVSLLPEFSHAGWARRLALDVAAQSLSAPEDVLASTDADTAVAPDWIVRNVSYLNSGIDAVAGRALTRRGDRAALGTVALRRLNLLGRYYTALDWLRSDMAPVPTDPWPRHYYEGGASIALTLACYRRIGGAPTPALGEDRALFDAVRAVGARVRHPIDVRVFTSSRIQGRAPGGMADAFARWISQSEGDPLHETYGLPAALDPVMARPEDRLSFETLPAAIATAGAIIRARRSDTAPQVEPILVPSLLPEYFERVA